MGLGKQWGFRGIVGQLGVGGWFFFLDTTLGLGQFESNPNWRLQFGVGQFGFPHYWNLEIMEDLDTDSHSRFSIKSATPKGPKHLTLTTNQQNYCSTISDSNVCCLPQSSRAPRPRPKPDFCTGCTPSFSAESGPQRLKLLKGLNSS